LEEFVVDQRMYAYGRAAGALAVYATNPP